MAVEGDGRVFEVDFGWPQLRTVGEFDGLAKYGRLLKPGQNTADLMVPRSAGIRWIWPEIDRFDPVAERLCRAFAASPAGAR